MKDETAFFLRSLAVIVVGIVLFAAVSIITRTPVAVRLPWDPDIF